MKKFSFKALFIALLLIFIPIFSYADDQGNKKQEFPSINSRHAVVFDRSSKQVIYGKKETETCKMASTTKIMTAIVVLENSNLNDTVIISKKAAQIGGSRLGLSTNDEIAVENLLYGLMMKSGNDAAVALAEYVAGSVEGFANMMNEKAKELKLTSTHFVTPHGLDDDGHYTTALDLAFLTDYALQNETFAKIVKTKTYTISLNGSAKTLSNTNELLGNLEGVYGVKTGFTNGANRCLVTSCKRGDLDIICVVLGCDTKKHRTSDSTKLINHTFKNYSLVNVKDIIIKNFEDWRGSHKNSFTINKGKTQNLDLYLDSNNFAFSHIAVNNSDLDNVKTNISFESYFEAPLPSNSNIGTLTLSVGDVYYLSINILNSNAVIRKGSFSYMFYIFKNYCSFFNTTN